jgi:hypothetical protein
MSQPFDTDVMEDLYESAEGPAQQRHFDEFEEGDDAFDEFEEEDEMEGVDEFAEDDTDALDAMVDAVTDALEEDDTDEFLRRLVRGVRSVARRVAPVVGRIARTVAPIASAIPLPQTQLIGRAAGLLGRLMADEADEFEMLDEMIDLAEEEDDIDAAAPIVAGLTIRRAMPNVSRLPRPQRRRIVQSVVNATRQVARQQGPRAAAAMPAVVRTARRGIAQRQQSVRRLPQAIRRTAARVARSPALTRRMAARSGLRSAVGRSAVGARARSSMGRGAMGRTSRYSGGGAACPTCGLRRTYNIRGPVRLSIRQL